jgi:hypothetical protein
MIYTPADSAELAAITTTAGDVVLLRSGVTYAASSVPASLLTPNNITLGMTGTGNRPIISAGELCASWTYDAGNNVYASAPYAANFLGNVTEDGVPMKFTAWTTDLATTAALMVAGQSLPAWAGSMTFNPSTRVLYVRPSAGVASEHQYVVSAVGSSGNCGLNNQQSARNLLIEDISVRHVSRHGVYLLNKIDPVLRNVEMRFIGGAKPSSLYMGNGLEMAVGVHGAQVIGCTASDIFDTGMTSQLYEGTAAQIGWHYYEDCTVERFGMHGIEVSVQTALQTINDVYVDGLTAVDAGTYCWGGNRNGAAFTCLSNSLNSGRVTRAFASNVRGSRMNRLYLGFQHGGVCGIEDSSATGTYGQAPTSAANGALNHRDIYRNVTDNLGALSGGWVASTARMSLNRASVML